MENMNQRFFDDVYLSFCDAFKLLCGELETKLKENGHDGLLDIRKKKARETVEVFKLIDRESPYSVPDESYIALFGTQSEYESVGGIMVVRRQSYKESYSETRRKLESSKSEGRFPGLIRLFHVDNLSLYLDLALEDFYWGQYLFSKGRKREGCDIIYDSFPYLKSCISDNYEQHKDYFENIRLEFKVARGKMSRSKGGQGRVSDFEYMKEYVVRALKEYGLQTGWKTKEEFYNEIVPCLVKYDKGEHPEKWIVRAWEREESIRSQLIKWSRGELKEVFNEVISRKRDENK